MAGFLGRKTNAKNKDGKILEVAVQRDVLGLLLAKSQGVNAPGLEKALKFPIITCTSGSPSFRWGKTNKIVLFYCALASTQPKKFRTP